MPSWMKKAIVLIYRAGLNLVHNDGMELAGYLSFLALLAVFPFFVLLVSVAGWIGQGDLGRHFIDLIFRHLPHDAVASIAPRIGEIISGPPQGLLTVSIFGAIWTASSAVEGMRTVLNRAYKVSEPPHFLLRRVISILQILLLTLLVIVVMSMLVFAPLVLLAFTSATGIIIPAAVSDFFAEDFVYVGAFALFCAISSLYYWLPNIKQSLLAVMPGALLVVTLWVGGAGLISFYLDRISNVNLIYGSLSSLIVTMIFFYVMNVIFIYGAEFNHQLMVVLGLRIVEKEHSETSADEKVIRKKPPTKKKR